MLDDDPTVGEFVAQKLRDVPDFPKPGILFKDLSPVFADRFLLALIATEIIEGLDPEAPRPQLVAGVEARGFVLAATIAAYLGTEYASSAGVLMVRKAGKLPPPTLRRSYDLEYGTAEIEVPAGLADGKHVLLVDDVLATGGTLRAAADLLVESGATLTGVAVILELGFLAGRAALAGLPEVTALLTI